MKTLLLRRENVSGPTTANNLKPQDFRRTLRWMLTSSNLHAHLFACFQTAQKVKFIQLLTSQDDRFPKLGPVNQQRVGLSCLQDLLCLFYVTWTSNKELIKLTQPKKAHVMQQLKVWKVLYIFCKARFRVRGTRYSLSTVGRPHETASAPSIWSSVRRPGPDQMHRRLLSHQLLRCTVSRQGGKPAFWMTAPSKRRDRMTDGSKACILTETDGFSEMFMCE